MKKFDMKSLLRGIEIFQKDQWEACKHYYRQHGKPVPVMSVISVNPTDASQSYMRNKRKYFNNIGIPFVQRELNSTNLDMIKTVLSDVNSYTEYEEYNLGTEEEPIMAKTVFGAEILQLPLPKELEMYETELIETIPHSSNNYADADGLCSPTVTELMEPKLVDQFTCLPCTPKGIMVIMDRYLHPEKSVSELLCHSYNWDNMLNGKHVVIVGRGKLVGRPLANLCITSGATVTVCNSKTPVADLIKLTRSADIIVLATGKIEGFDSSICSVDKPQLIIDCGIGYNNEGKLRGDFKSDDNFNFDITYTAVPGGVGPMTVSMLCQNFLEIQVNRSGVDE